MLRSTAAVVVVDNRSTDGTGAVAERVAESLGLADRLTVVEYPHVLSRCGAEHLGTPADSPQSLVELNNWALQQVRTRHALKWDGDMVLSPEGEVLLSDLGWQLDTSPVSVRLRHYPVYVQDDRVAHVDLGVRNVETYGYPVSPDYTYVKGFEWEVLHRPPTNRSYLLPAGICIELKHLSEDEFSHWTDPASFATSTRNSRKRREYAIFQALRGEGPEVPGTVRLEAPPGTHVVDHVLDRLPHLPGVADRPPKTGAPVV